MAADDVGTCGLGGSGGSGLAGGSLDGMPKAVRPTSSPVRVREVFSPPGASDERTVRGGSSALERGRPSASALVMRKRRSGWQALKSSLASPFSYARERAEEAPLRELDGGAGAEPRAKLALERNESAELAGLAELAFERRPKETTEAGALVARAGGVRLPSPVVRVVPTYEKALAGGTTRGVGSSTVDVVIAAISCGPRSPLPRFFMESARAAVYRERWCARDSARRAPRCRFAFGCFAPTVRHMYWAAYARSLVAGHMG